MATSRKNQYRASENKICEIFRVPSLNQIQKKVLSAYGDGKDVLVCSRTGSGKSLMFQACGIVDKEDCVLDIFLTRRDAQDDVQGDANLFGDSIVVIIVPLIAIMREQTVKLESMGFSATYIGKDAAEDTAILEGRFSFVYGSPEQFVGIQKWRDMLHSEAYSKRLKCIAVDEAHTVVNWGESRADEEPFRQWFSRIGELRSLCPGVQMITGTATAGVSTRRKIMQSLCLSVAGTKVIVDSPDRPNIMLSVRKVKGTHSLKETFGYLVENLNSSLDRHLIFCRSIMDCERVYHIFRNHGGLVEMYHSKTPELVKTNIRNDMSLADGQIRILVCTNAAGMGVNFAGLVTVINYGPPYDVDTFLQQLGRAGRDGAQAHSILVYHKRQTKKVESSLVNFLNESSCRRVNLIDTNYGQSLEKKTVAHFCCDNCAENCDCGEEDCVTKFAPEFILWVPLMDEQLSGPPQRKSTLQQRENLNELLCDYQQLSKHQQKVLVGADIISCMPDSLVKEILDKCDFLVDASDVYTKTSVLSWSQALAISDIFHAVFPATFMEDSMDLSEEEQFDG